MAVEADWPDAYRVNRFVRGLGADADAVDALEDFQCFPAWTKPARRTETRRCFVRQWMQFARNRDVQTTSRTAPDDVASVEAALRAFEESGLHLRAAIIAVAQTDAFLRL